MGFLSNHGVRNTPEPITCCFEENLGLYRFIEGREVTCKDVSYQRVQELLSFFATINQLRPLPDALLLPNASEACFSIREHLLHIQTRIERLAAIEINSDIDSQAVDFVNERLRPAWQQISKKILMSMPDESLLRKCIIQEEIVLSPSDFGFHNALIKPDGPLIFIDFEYAGWDDPVKTISDLFCQPKVPIDFRYFESTAVSLLKESGGDLEKGMSRLRLLFPAYQVKWCCILLNEYLPVGNKRRSFADPLHRTDARKAQQLEKAEKLIHNHHYFR